MVCPSPVAAVTTYHRIGGLKQHIHLFSYSSGSWNSDLNLQDVFLLRVPAYRGCLFLWLSSEPAALQLFFSLISAPSSHTLFIVLAVQLLSCTDPDNHIRPIQIAEDNLSISRSLITPANSLLLWKAMCWQFWELGCGPPGGITQPTMCTGWMEHRVCAAYSPTHDSLPRCHCCLHFN